MKIMSNAIFDMETQIEAHDKQRFTDFLVETWSEKTALEQARSTVISNF